jgi:rhamnulose-1-phosphate aldolase
MEFHGKQDEIQRKVADMARLGQLLWQKGWAERNAGNISVDVTEYVTDLSLVDTNHPEPHYVVLEQAYLHIAGHTFLVTGTGTRMRDIAIDPPSYILMIQLDEPGKHFRIHPLSLTSNNLQPTSELPTHLSIHNQLAANNAPEKAIVHTHATELITITQVKEFCNESRINQMLWGMHPETKVFLPEGIGFVPYQLPGSQEIARATLNSFEKHRVVTWEKHGCLAIGTDVFTAFDLIDTVSKSALIYLQCKSAGIEPEGLGPEQITALQQLSEKFIGS